MIGEAVTELTGLLGSVRAARAAAGRPQAGHYRRHRRTPLPVRTPCEPKPRPRASAPAGRATPRSPPNHPDHADNGTSTASKPVAFLLVDPGVTNSRSRPRTSNDNLYSEAPFKTLKCRPDLPDRFDTIEQSRTFFTWYNTAHRPSGAAWHTPHEVRPASKILITTALSRVRSSIQSA